MAAAQNINRTILILGGSYAGLHVAHALLKNESRDYKVILVSQSSHLYWNLASVRAVIPDKVRDEDIFQPLAAALSRYQEDTYELVIGTAIATDFAAKTVDVVPAAAGPMRTFTYEHLILATGSRPAGAGMPWKSDGTYQETLDRLHQTAMHVRDAQHIVIGGAGPTGVELAGELGQEYGKTKQIVLLCPDAKLLHGDRIAKAAAKRLRDLHVTIEYNARVRLYLSTAGILPNIEYLPAQYLRDVDTGYRGVDVDECLRVRGTNDVWACGDIVGLPRPGFFITQKQAAAVAHNLLRLFRGKPPVPAREPFVDTFACSIGPKGGAGRLWRVSVPSVGIRVFKASKLGMNKIREYMSGEIAR